MRKRFSILSVPILAWALGLGAACGGGSPASSGFDARDASQDLPGVETMDPGSEPGDRDVAPADGITDVATDLAAADAAPDVASACPHGVNVCAKDQGCRDDLCGPCVAPKNCRPLQGCLPDGHCGDCTLDEQCDAGRVCRHGYCVRESLPTWSVTLAPTDFQAILADPYAIKEVPCQLAVDDQAYADACTIRVHGGASRDYPKKSFRIEYAQGKEHPGYSRKLTLRAEYNDASMLRNFLANEFFRQATDVPAARAHHVWLRVNDADYGLMLLVERVGEDFLEGWGRDRTAPMYECDPPLDLMREGSGAFVPLPDEATYEATYDKKAGPDGTWADLRSLIEDAVWQDWLESTRLQTTTRRTAPLIAVDRYLDYLAAMGVLQNHDHVRKNYVLSRQDDGSGPKWEFYPTDLDMTFGCLWDEAAQDVICDSTTTNDAWDRGVLPDAPAGYPVQAFYNQLIQQVLRDPALQPRFQARICTLLAGPFWQDGLPRLIDAMDEALAAAVAKDTRDRAANEAAFHKEVQELRRFRVERANFLRKELGCPSDDGDDEDEDGGDDGEER